MADAEQLDIFGGSTPFPTMEPRGVRRGERGGSAEAAKIPTNPRKYVVLLQVIHGCMDHGITDDEIALRFSFDHPGTMSKRRLALERAGLIEDSKRTRKTRRGVEAMVFTITDRGRQVLQEWANR